jgi:hypothetical protein
VNSGLGLLPLTVPEVRRLLVALVWTARVQPGLVLAWSRWRRRHQAQPGAHTTGNASSKAGSKIDRR